MGLSAVESSEVLGLSPDQDSELPDAGHPGGGGAGPSQPEGSLPVASPVRQLCQCAAQKVVSPAAAQSVVEAWPAMVGGGSSGSAPSAYVRSVRVVGVACTPARAVVSPRSERGVAAREVVWLRPRGCVGRDMRGAPRSGPSWCPPGGRLTAAVRIPLGARVRLPRGGASERLTLRV